MPQEPSPPAPARRAARPAQVLRNSPLAASPRMLGLRASQRPRPPLAWRRVLAISGSVIVHVLFLFAFILGPAWEPPPLAESKTPLKARFIELPDLAPPPPPKGERPRQVGPVHQGHAAARRASAATAAVAVATSPPSPPPSPELQAVPLASQPPTISAPQVKLQAPVPPKFQPQPVRAPQREGTQPMPPPPSLALPTVPAHAPSPTLAAPSVALDKLAPTPMKPVLAPPTLVALAAPPPAPEPALQAVPLAAPSAPEVRVQASALHAPAPVAVQLPKLPAAALVPVEAPLAAIPQESVAAPRVAAVDKAALRLTPAATAPGKLAVMAPVAVAAPDAAPAAGDAGQADASRAPDALPQGSDSARVGEPQGSAQALPSASVHGNGPLGSHGLGKLTGATATATGHTATGLPTSGKPAAGAQAAGVQASPGEPEYIQLKPTGDTAVMRHNVHGVDYKPTRFDPDWAPQNESAIDSVLRRAAEKTTTTHTFHLPRGIRIKCAVMPLVPVALLGCGNADAPPKAAAQKMYDRLNLPAPKGGSVPTLPPPAPAASAAKPATPVKLGNAAICAEARLTGGPQPPGCPPLTPQQSEYHPASSSSSWVPASDQFH